MFWKKYKRVVGLYPLVVRSYMLATCYFVATQTIRPPPTLLFALVGNENPPNFTKKGKKKSKQTINRRREDKNGSVCTVWRNLVLVSADASAATAAAADVTSILHRRRLLF